MVSIRSAKNQDIEKVKLKLRAEATRKTLMVLLCPKRVSKLLSDIDGLCQRESNDHNQDSGEVNKLIRNSTVQLLHQSQALIRRILRHGDSAIDEHSREQPSQAATVQRKSLNTVRKTEWGLTQLSYSEFQNKALEKGAKIAHLITKVYPEFPKAVKRPNLEQDLAKEELKWHKLWKVEQDSPSFRKEVLRLGAAHSIQDIRKVSASFPSATSCTDGLHVKAIQLLSDPMIESLAKLYRLAEAYGGYPEELAHMIIKMIPKTDGTSRPIVLFRSVYRLHGRLLGKRN